MKLTQELVTKLITDTTTILRDTEEFEHVESFDFILDCVKVVINGKSIYIEFDVYSNRIYFFKSVDGEGYRMISCIVCDPYLEVSIVTLIAIRLMKIKDLIV